MKILFLVDNTGRPRHFEGVIRSLAERGHAVTIAATRESRLVATPDGLDHPRISVGEAPSARGDEWRDLVEPIRVARDYARYFDPRFAGAGRLRRRAEVKAGNLAGGFKRFCESRPWVRRQWRLVGRALGLVEDLVPSDGAFEAFLRAEQPDLVLVTPLIQYGSYQTDYVKAAHALGLPIALLVFSWDNLTNKGLIRVIPDRVLVWNETQHREAVDLHGVPPERVVLTGAPRFDEFFAMRPSTTREEFCAAAGLDPARPFVLYLCSSRFVAGREVEFVRRWIGELRRAADPPLRTCGILIRPYPILIDQWRGFAPPDDVAVWRQPRTVNADPSLYDSLYHAAAVVGLNTSAMIEAGIVGKPVYTVLADEVEGQEGTLHFEYLLRANGGLVEPARDFDEHRTQLAAALTGADAGREQTRRFLEAFVRPRGLDRPATPIMVAEIERLAELQKRPARTPFWHRPARRALRAWLARHGRAASAASPDLRPSRGPR